MKSMEEMEKFSAYCKELYEKFDALPKAERIRLAYSIGIFGDDYQKAAAHDFGPDHPQAQGHFCTPLKR